MIKSIKFEGFRNLSGTYIFNKDLNVIVGKNNTGKSNVLDGIRLAFSSMNGDYFKVSKTDFYNSDDTKPIKIEVQLRNNSIPTLNFYSKNSTGAEIKKCGFQLVIRGSRNGRYIKEVNLLDGSNISMDILINDDQIPDVNFIPLVRIEDIYTKGLTAGLSNFIDSEEKYIQLREDSKTAIKEELKAKEDEFISLCGDFDQTMKIELSDPKFSNEKVFIVDGDEEHNFRIGSGYKSIANIMLNTLNSCFTIILIDEIENHLHPALIRKLIRKLRKIDNVIIIGTTHSSVVINELEMAEILDISGVDISFLGDPENSNKLKTFLHPGRNELIMADKVIFVEGYTEELLFNYYLKDNNNNWTIVNVAGVMFEPYLKLAYLLKKRVVVVSDSDIAVNDGVTPTSRFENLSLLCVGYDFKLVKVHNTLESDLHKEGFLSDYSEFIQPHIKYQDIYVAKPKKKVQLAMKLMIDNLDLSKWRVMEEIINEFENN